MSPAKRRKAGDRKEVYDHVLRSMWSAYHVLIECCHDIEDIDLDAARNTRDLNLILHWVHEASAEIYKLYPELAPPDREPPPRRWPKDPKTRGATPDLTRDEALERVRRHLELAQLILSESVPFARQLKLASEGLDEQLRKVSEVHKAVVDELWKDLADERKRAWIRHSGKSEWVTEPPQPDRHKALGRLNEKLETASKVLDDCAGLVVDLELEPKTHLRAIGSCLATIFEVQDQIYSERPDLIPEFLRPAYELRTMEGKDQQH